MDQNIEEEVVVYVPRYIKQIIDYKKKEMVTSDDYNNILNLLITASDYNTEMLNAIFNNAEIELVINSSHAGHSDTSDLAANSSLLDNAALSRQAVTSLLDSDEHIPTSKQAKTYVDLYIDEVKKNMESISTNIDNVVSKNVEQDNRLSNLDLINNGYGTRITALESFKENTTAEITGLKQVDNAQDTILSSHNDRITQLELGNVPEEVLKTLMSKGSYAYQTGLDSEGQPVYSTDTVKQAHTTNNVNINGTIMSTSNLVTADTIAEIEDAAFITRGALPISSDVVNYVSDIKLLENGAYYCTAQQAARLGASTNTGTLRVYPANNGVSLEFEIQSGSFIGRLKTLFISYSTPDNTDMTTFVWQDISASINEIINDVANLTTSKLEVTNLQEGLDISLNKVGNNTTFNYTGPKFVTGPDRPAADPNRKTIWFKI